MHLRNRRRLGDAHRAARRRSRQDTGGLPDTRGNKMMWEMCTPYPLKGP
jgi:hypothetical protein